MMIPPFSVPTGRSMFGDCWYQRIPTTKSKIWNLRLRFQFPPKTSLPYGSKSRLLRRYKLDTPRSVATRYVDSKGIRADPGGSIRADPRYRRSSPPICREKKPQPQHTSVTFPARTLAARGNAAPISGNDEWRHAAGFEAEPVWGWICPQVKKSIIIIQYHLKHI